jgi:hypothetical protein
MFANTVNGKQYDDKFIANTLLSQLSCLKIGRKGKILLHFAYLRMLALAMTQTARQGTLEQMQTVLSKDIPSTS